MATQERSSSNPRPGHRNYFSHAPPSHNVSFTDQTKPFNPPADGLPRKPNRQNPQPPIELPESNQSHARPHYYEDREPKRKRSIAKIRGNSATNERNFQTEPSRRHIEEPKKENKDGKAFSNIRGLTEKMSSLYRESNMLFEQLISERSRLRGEQEQREYTQKLLDQMQIMLGRLHEVEIGLLQNEADFHQALVRIQGDIKVKNTETRHEKAMFEGSLASQEKTINELLAEKKVLQITVEGLRKEIKDLKEYSFERLHTEVKGQRDQMVGAVSNVAQSYQHILYLQRENSALKNEISLLQRKFDDAVGKKSQAEIGSSGGENQKLKQQLEIANKRIQGLRLDVEELSLLLQRKNGGPETGQQKTEQRTLPYLATKLSKWSQKDRYIEPEREDVVQNQMLLLEKELRRGCDAGLIDNREFARDIFNILNKTFELRVKEKQKNKAQLKEAYEMAEEKIAGLKEELQKEGTHMDKEVEKLNNEIDEWKKENQYVAGLLRKQNEVANSLQEELTQITQIKNRQSNDLLQNKVTISKLEKQVQELASRLAGQNLAPLAPTKNDAMVPPSRDSQQTSPLKSSSQVRGSGDQKTPGKLSSGVRSRGGKFVGREFVGFTGNLELYRKKNKNLGSTFGSLSSFYEGLLRLEELDPEKVKKRMTGGVKELMELTKEGAVEEMKREEQRIIDEAARKKRREEIKNGEYIAEEDEEYDEDDEDEDEYEYDEGNDEDEEEEEEEEEDEEEVEAEEDKKEDNTRPKGSVKKKKDDFTGNVWGIYKDHQEDLDLLNQVNHQMQNGEIIDHQDEEDENEEDDEGEKEGDEAERKLTEYEDMDQLQVEEIPNILSNKYNPGRLSPLRPDARLTFQEFAARWKGSEKEETKIRLLEILNSQEALVDEGLRPENIRDMLIIIKEALANEKPVIYQLALRILASFATAKKITKVEFLQVKAIGVAMRCLHPRVTAENADSFVARTAAAFEILTFMADEALPWTDVMSTMLMKNNGLSTILKGLISKNEWQLAQACRVTYYMIANKKLVNELRDQNGMSLLILNLESKNRTIRMSCVKAIALMTKNTETRERYLAKKDNKLDEVLSKIIQNEPEFIKYLLDIMANLIENKEFASLLLEDMDEFEQMLAILEDVENEACKNGVYRVFSILARDEDTHWKIYSLSYKIMIKHLSGTPREYAKSLLTALDILTSRRSKLQIDYEIFQGLAKFLGKPNQTVKATIILALKVTATFFDRHGDQFKEWILRKNYQEVFFTLYFGPMRDTKITIALNNIFELFLSNPDMIKPFLGPTMTPLLKNLLDQLRKKDDELKNSAASNLKYILEDTLTHRFVNIPDLKKIVELLVVEPERTSKTEGSPSVSTKRSAVSVTPMKLSAITQGLSVLVMLSIREEFTEIFIRMDLPKHILSILTMSEPSSKIINSGLEILKNIFSSIYGKSVVKKLYKIENNAGIELLSRLCLPPIDSNEAAKNSVPIWGCLADEVDEETFEVLKKNDDSVFENLIDILQHREAVLALKTEVNQYVQKCQEDPELAKRIRQIALRKRDEERS